MAILATRGRASSSLRSYVRRFMSGVVDNIVAVVDGVPVIVHERLARETLGGERGAPTADAYGESGTDLTGIRVWESAPYLVRFLEGNRERLIQGRCVLDLGSGTGAVGLTAAALGAQSVVLSDIDSTATLATDRGWEEGSTLAALADNVALNGTLAATTAVAELRWGCAEQIAALRAAHAPGGFDTILGSDLLYYKPEQTYGALATTIRALAAPDAAVVLSYRVRHGQEHTFVDALTGGGDDSGGDDSGSGGGSGGGGAGLKFQLAQRGAADLASLSQATHATRVVEMRACGFGWADTAGSLL